MEETMQTELTVEEVKSILTRDSKGGVANTIGNCVTALTNDPELKGRIQFNEFADTIDISDDVTWKKTGKTINDTDYAYIRLMLEDRYGLTNENRVMAAVRIAADTNKYNPLKSQLESFVWDGQERVETALHHFFGTDINQYTREVLKVFMLGAINRVYEPGSKFDTMLCLTGAQGVGKSTFFRFLAIRDEWFTDDLGNLNDRHIYEQLQGHWIIEMSEMLATINAKSNEEVKSFLSRQVGIHRPVYGRFASDYPRKCVFGGTTNKIDFLPKDRSGDRRFFPVQVNADKAEVHILDNEEASREYINQMWAEVMTIYKTGEFMLKLSEEADRILSDLRHEFVQEDAIADQLYGWFAETKETRVCTRMLYHDVLRNFNDPHDYDLRNIGEIVNTGIRNGKITGWVRYDKPKRFRNYGTQRGWEKIMSTGKCTDDVTPAVYDSSALTDFPDKEEIPF